MSSDLPALKLYNTLTHAKEEFRPLDPLNVRMYVCGPTVYDYAHIGNARPLIVFDVLFRLLRHRYGEKHVTYVRNITDVDDKINARAAERGISIRELTEETNAIFQEDARALGCLEPTAQPRATEHIADMLAIIEKLIARGHAYMADGNVLFDVPSWKEYGGLSRRPLDEMIAGARVEVAPYKRSDMDFVLWKPSKEGEPAWDSPWGRGRPGWHIECSAMSWRRLGEVFDIHGGGVDLVFPHHENEIAQSRCAFGRNVMANYWMHNGFLQVEGEKMSKSLGNFVTIHELLHTETFGGRKWPGEVLRLAMLKTHYRQPIDWTVKALEEAEKTLYRWRRYVNWTLGLEDDEPGRPKLAVGFLERLADDLNTPAALSRVHELYLVGPTAALQFGEESSGASLEDQRTAAAQLRGCLKLLGLQEILEPCWGETEIESAARERAESLIAARAAARAAKNWAESDRIRDELARMGVALHDNKDGTTTWEVRR